MRWLLVHIESTREFWILAAKYWPLILQNKFSKGRWSRAYMKTPMLAIATSLHHKYWQLTFCPERLLFWHRSCPLFALGNNARFCKHMVNLRNWKPTNKAHRSRSLTANFQGRRCQTLHSRHMQDSCRRSSAKHNRNQLYLPGPWPLWPVVFVLKN